MPHALRKAPWAFTASITTLAVVVLDLHTKTLWFESGRSQIFSNGLLQTVNHRNYGLVFDIPTPTWIVLALSTCALIAFVLYAKHAAPQNIRTAIALGCLIGGALGNGYDRLIFGYVRDWILVYGRSALNIADLFIGLGMISLAFSTKKIALDDQV